MENALVLGPVQYIMVVLSKVGFHKVGKSADIDFGLVKGTHTEKLERKL